MRRGGALSPSATTDSKPTIREVNNLLHNLRGEHFRQERNRNPTTPVSPSSHYVAPDKPTLPISQIFGSDDAIAKAFDNLALDLDAESAVREDRSQPAWRKKALSLLFAYAPLRVSDEESDMPAWNEEDDYTIPPLTLFCLRALAGYCRSVSSFAEDLVPYLPPHLRRLLLRWTAVHAPLSNTKLYALCEPEMGGHADGELIVVGPHASLPKDYFKTADVTDEEAFAFASSSQSREDDPPPPESWTSTTDTSDTSWDSSSSYTKDEPPPLLSLALISLPIPVHTLFTLPRTLTHLALLSLPTLTPIHRLPRLLPNIEVLDLSYNVWLGQPKIVSNANMAGESLLWRTEWVRWGRLRVLGLRECGVGKGEGGGCGCEGE
ncbi:hypothetical protein EIP91_003825 [Steccherinum ochraceum]|uniref:Uncharacterized protein n=1 Tax=Steccherinum ochraceum TaxID=92696 RepID=A0A4R0RQI0_9APHY|nr:hypothetical protein EIP91_003825 [Steccherinum ochraceum]